MKIHGDLTLGECLKMKYASDYLNLPHEWGQIDAGTGRMRNPEFLALNPHAQISLPVLDDGRAVRASKACFWYRARDSEWLPQDTVDQAF